MDQIKEQRREEQERLDEQEKNATVGGHICLACSSSCPVVQLARKNTHQNGLINKMARFARAIFAGLLWCVFSRAIWTTGQLEPQAMVGGHTVDGQN